MPLAAPVIRHQRPFISTIEDVLLCFFHGGDHLVAPGVELGVVRLQLGGGQHVADGLAQALVGAHRAGKARHSALNLAVVKHDGIGLIADEAALEVILARLVQEVGGHIVGLEGNAQLIRDDAVDLVPGDGLVRGDVVGFTKVIANPLKIYYSVNGSIDE